MTAAAPDDLGLFDPCVDLSVRADLDLENLEYFGLRRWVGAVSPAGRSATPAALAAAVGDALATGAARVRREPHRAVGLCLGIPEGRAPAREHSEVWRQLEVAVAPALVAVGPVEVSGGRGRSTLAAHARLAEVADVPLLVRLPPGSVAAGSALEAIAQCGARPAAVVVVGCDYTNVRVALEAGAYPVLDASPAGLGVDGAADLIARYGVAIRDRVMLSVASGPSLDVLAPSKLVSALLQRGITDPAAPLQRNAAVLFAPRGVQPAAPPG
ncbi:MAG: hypothetical protein H6700_02065 [Myxococcales bacterium]|nr:hypothetical protein [Myxococcales bacterium]MCB9521173.1 hypothetical protein [Myxococcales bacterium]MCB9530531.1 hypothetical protein [Myxococcales bacterium]